MSDRHYTNPTDSNEKNHLPLESDDFDLDSLPPDCVAIPLKNGGYALVDEEDLCRVDEHDWFKGYIAEARTWYVHSVRKILETHSGKQLVSMHRFLFGLGPGDRTQVDHKNHNGLDNRRSTNLRLATRAQNSANARRFKVGSSHYRGVSWDRLYKKWRAEITVTSNGIKKKYSIGSFNSEGEAAFAHQVAAPLLMDPEFLVLDEIPDDVLPDEARRSEIKGEVIAKIKARSDGRKGKVNPTSHYHGVSYSSQNDQWKSDVSVGKICYFLGLFKSDIEAAYAHDYGITFLGLANKKSNNICESDLNDRSRAIEIRSEVSRRIAIHGTGRKVRLGTTSNYRCVHRNNKNSRCTSYIRFNKKRIHLGSFPNEIEAAYAYNVAVTSLKTTRLLPNPIAEKDLPLSETMDLIRRNVERKLKITSPEHPEP